MKIEKLKDGTYEVESRSSSGKWIVSANLKSCNCPKFKYILKGQGQCHHITAVMDFLKVIKTPVSKDFTEYTPHTYVAPLNVYDFVAKYGDDQLDNLLQLNEVVMMSGMIIRLI